MLVPIEEMKAYFVCPANGEPLVESEDGWFLTPDGAARYPLLDGLPVLVDFNQSILSKDSVMASSAASAVPRQSRGKLGSLLKHLVSPPKHATSQNVRTLLHELRNGCSERSVLVVGGGEIGQGMQPLYDAEDIRVVGFDVYASQNVQLIADGHQIPFADNSFDSVIVQAVLEHVLDPWSVVKEIHRVLRTGGIVYAETPFLQQVHEGAYDFTRFTESGHRYLFKDFDLIRSGASAGPGTQAVWTIEYLARSVFRSKLVGKLAKVGLFWIRYLDMIIPDSYQIDSASGVYFLGRKNGRTMSMEEIVQHYSGADR